MVSDAEFDTIKNWLNAPVKSDEQLENWLKFFDLSNGRESYPLQNMGEALKKISSDNQSFCVDTFLLSLVDYAERKDVLSNHAQYSDQSMKNLFSFMNFSPQSSEVADKIFEYGFKVYETILENEDLRLFLAESYRGQYQVLSPLSDLLLQETVQSEIVHDLRLLQSSQLKNAIHKIREMYNFDSGGYHLGWEKLLEENFLHFDPCKEIDLCLR